MKSRQQNPAIKIAAAFSFAVTCTLTGTGLLGVADAQQPTPVTQEVEQFEFAPVPPIETLPIPKQSIKEQSTASIQKVGYNQNDHRGGAQLIGTNLRPSNSPSTAGIPARQLIGGNANPLQPIAQTGFNSPSTSPVSSGPQLDLYTIKNATWKSIEDTLVNGWGTSAQIAATEDGRFSQIVLPVPGKDQSIRMMIDRSNNQVVHQGDPQTRAQWARLIQEVDQTNNWSNSVQVIPVAEGDCGTYIQVAYRLGFTQDEQNPETTDDVVRLFEENPEQEPLIETRVAAGPVRITYDKATNYMVISGPPEKVAEIMESIKEIRTKNRASRSTFKLVPLKNVPSNEELATTIQEAYDQSFGTQMGVATVRSIKNPNSLLVTGAPKSVEQIERLANSMDVPSATGVDPNNPEKDFTTFRLVYISAIDAKQRIDEYFGIANDANRNPEIQPSGQPVVTIADFRSNSLIVKAGPLYIQQVRTLLSEIDVAKVEKGAKDIVRVVKLRNSSAADMVNVIMSAISGQLPGSATGDAQGTSPFQNANGVGGGGNVGGGNNNQNQPQQIAGGLNTSSIRSPQLQLETIDGNGNVVRDDGGFMFDVRVVADLNSNSLIVNATETSMPLVLELIKQLDQLPDAETQIKVFEVINADASRLFELLSQLLGGGQAGNQGGGGGAGGANTASNIPLQSANQSEGSSLVNLRFAFDDRTNTIIASGPVGELEVVYELINRLDVDDRRERIVEVYHLSNAPVTDVQETLQAWLDRREEATAGVLTSTLQQFNREIVITAEASSNSLLVTALPEYMPELERIIKALDRRPSMVQVKVMIAEVNLSALEEFGVEVGVQDSVLFDRGLGTIGFPFNSESLGNTNVGRDTLASQALSNLSLGRINSDLGYGGLVLSAGNDSVNILLRALQDKNCVKVLSKPQLMTIDNLQGRMQVGASVPYVTGVQQNQAGGISNTTEFQEIGVLLSITPRISPDGMVVMFVDVENSSLGSIEAGIPIFVSDGQEIRQPQINRQTAQTAVMARSGQTVVFSGLISETKSQAVRGAPILKDLPVIGPLFRFETESSSRSELLIFLTPQIVNSDGVLDQVNMDAMSRLHWCESDVAEVYGSVNLSGDQAISDGTRIVFPDDTPAGVFPQIKGTPHSAQGMSSNEAGQPAYESQSNNDWRSIPRNADRNATEINRLRK